MMENPTMIKGTKGIAAKAITGLTGVGRDCPNNNNNPARPTPNPIDHDVTDRNCRWRYTALSGRTTRVGSGADATGYPPTQTMAPTKMARKIKT